MCIIWQCFVAHYSLTTIFLIHFLTLSVIISIKFVTLCIMAFTLLLSSNEQNYLNINTSQLDCMVGLPRPVPSISQTGNHHKVSVHVFVINCLESLCLRNYRHCANLLAFFPYFSRPETFPGFLRKWNLKINTGFNV